MKTHDEEMRKLEVNGLFRAYNVISERAQKSTGRGIWNIIRSHNMRKFFNTTLKNAGFDSERVEFFMGHTLDGTKGAYYRAEADKLKALYANFVPYLTIQKELDVASTPEYKKLVTENQDLKAAKEYYHAERGELETLARELEEIKATIREQKEEEWYSYENGKLTISPMGMDNCINYNMLLKNLGRSPTEGRFDPFVNRVVRDWIEEQVATEGTRIQYNKRKEKIAGLF